MSIRNARISKANKVWSVYTWFSTMLRFILIVHFFIFSVKSEDFCSKDDLLCSVKNIQDKFEELSKLFFNFTKPKSVDKLVKMYKKQIKIGEKLPKYKVKLVKKLVKLDGCGCEREILVNENTLAAEKYCTPMKHFLRKQKFAGLHLP